MAWTLAPLRSRATYPGMPCTAAASTFIERTSYTLFFLPLAPLLLALAATARRAYRQGRLALTIGLIAAGVAISGGYLAFAGIPAQPQQERATACPQAGKDFEPLHCWTTTTAPAVFEMNAFGRRPSDVASLDAMGKELAAQKRDVFLYEAFILDTRDPAIAEYSNARLFVLQRPNLSVFGNQCLGERKAKLLDVQGHRVGFYRYSVQQSPPVDAFFLQDIAQNGELQFEVLDFLHKTQLPYVAPLNLQAEESAYLDEVAASLQTLNDDLDREQRTNAPPGALAQMHADFERVTANLARNVPARLVLYRDSRLKRFLENYDLILVAEEHAAQGQSEQKIHSSAYQQHRLYYFQEPRVTRLIGYLYLQEPGQTFSDEMLSTVNWAVF